MYILKKIYKPINNNKGNMVINVLIGLVLFTIVFLYSIDLFNAALEYQNVTYSAKSIAKVIECDGAVTDRAYQQMEALNKSFNMDMTFDVSDVKYFDSRKRSIQFRDPFKVTVRYKSEIQIASPLFQEPVVMKLNMVSGVPGMSEVYWK